MGCICSKGAKSHSFVEKLHANASDNENKSSNRRSSKEDEVVLEIDNACHDGTARLITDNVVPTPVSSDEGEKKLVAATLSFERSITERQLQRNSTMDVGSSGHGLQPRMTRIVSVSNSERGAQVVAGWPTWLTAVAGEAINGWVPRKADSFEKLEKIGQGTYSSVYKARDLETNKMVALKKVRFANMDPESVRFMAREIIILRRLDHPNVMKLEGLITSRMSGSLYLIFEYMEHDLSGLAASNGVKFTESQIKCYMKQLLNGLEHCHSRGVLHRDIKGSNLLIDYKGNLKIGDFGLATSYNSHNKQPLTSRVVTLWYRPPELLLGSTDYGVSVDLWSSGCILAELFAGKPIMPGRTEVEQLHKIFKLCGSPSEEYWKRSKLPHATIFKPQHPYKRCFVETFKAFPSSALALLDIILAVEPEARGTAAEALQSEFFTTKPLPCDPSSLPKYPPTKEFDVKVRDENARRQRAAGKGREHDSSRKRDSKAVPEPNANAELQASIQKRREHSNNKCTSEKFNPDEDCGSGFLIEPHKGTEKKTYSNGQSGSSKLTTAKHDIVLTPSNSTDVRNQRAHLGSGAAQLSKFSNSVGVTSGSMRFESCREATLNAHWPEERANGGYDQVSERHQWSRHLLERTNSSRKEDVQCSGKETSTVYVPNKSRIHYSGPLMPPGGNLDEMLKEHERQIQNAVRKARMGKDKTKKNGMNGQTESLLYGMNGR
ncbi:hypothetical protein ACFE04_023830 [Oxalis oulophora]